MKRIIIIIVMSIIVSIILSAVGIGYYVIGVLIIIGLAIIILRFMPFVNKDCSVPIVNSQNNSLIESSEEFWREINESTKKSHELLVKALAEKKARDEARDGEASIVRISTVVDNVRKELQTMTFKDLLSLKTHVKTEIESLTDAHEIARKELILIAIDSIVADKTYKKEVEANSIYRMDDAAKKQLLNLNFNNLLRLKTSLKTKIASLTDIDEIERKNTLLKEINIVLKNKTYNKEEDGEIIEGKDYDDISMYDSDGFDRDDRDDLMKF